MAHIDQNITGADKRWFIGEDKILRFTIYTSEAETAIQDVSGYALAFDLRKGVDDSAALITKTTGAGDITITGTYNSAPGTNTQKVNVAIADTDTASLKAGDYEYSLKRTDDGSETVLVEGTATLLAATLK